MTNTSPGKPKNAFFLTIDSEMGTLMRTTDWTSVGLGHPSTWPLTLSSKLNTIMGAAFPMFLFWGKDLICFYNDAYRPCLGINGKHPALGKKAKDVWPETWDFIGPLIERVKATGKSAWFEDKLLPIYRNGRMEDVYWTFSYSPVTDEEEQIAGVVVVCMETTEKVNLLKRLEESNNLYSFAIEASELGTWDLDPKTNKFQANNRLKEWFGVEGDADVDLTAALGAIAEKDRDRVTKAIGQAIQYSSGGHYDVEYTVVNMKTGQERIVKAKGKATFNDQKEPVRFNGTLQDITTEVQAREQNKKLSILVENSVDLMAILRMDGKNAYINKAGKELLGIDEDADVTAIPITDFHTPEQFEFVASTILPGVMATGKWAGEFGIRNGKTGEIIPLYNNCHRIDDERTGEPIGVGTVMRDIRSELNARQRLEEQVKERTQELEKLNEQLERKNKDLASFAYVSSHDLQEPLRKINTFISRIEENQSGLTDKNALYFNKIKASATRMQVLINDLLNFSRTSTTDGQLELTDLNHLLEEATRDFQYKWDNDRHITVAGNLPSIPVIPFQLRQLFTNLIGNSVKFAKPGEPLKVTVSYTGTVVNNDEHYHHISFSDNGIGFDNAYKDKIFEVFQRLHSKDIYEGTGIGLSLCKRIMENHNGYINGEGEPGVGATFNLYFPKS